MRKGKRGFAIAFEPIVWWLIAFIVFVLMLLAYFILKGKGGGAIDFWQRVIKFRF